MKNSLKEIYQWQMDAGNAIQVYDDFLESSFQIEEALESLPFLNDLAEELDINPDQPKLPKQLSRQIISIALGGKNDIIHKDKPSNLDRLDKACDAIVFAIGSMAKLGLNAQEINEALNIVNNANKAKLGCKRDEHGKLMKPKNFDEKYAPEPKLQALLTKVDIRNQ